MNQSPTAADTGSTPMPVTLGLLAALLFAGAFYLSYSQNAWFLQDDFQLILRYAHNLQPQEVLDFGNVGRFLTRNVYWHFGAQLFHLHAPLYYLLNLCFIGATSFLAYRLIALQHGRFAGFVAGLLYFCLPGTIESYAWLSNSQHLVCHFFVLLFVYLFTTRDVAADPRSHAKAVALLMLVLLLGLWSNTFMGMVLSLPLWLLLADSKHRNSRWNYALPVMGLALFFYFYFRLKGHQVGAYATSLSFGTVRTNAAFYFKGDAGAAVWIAVVLGGAAFSWAKGRLFSAWLLLASVAFFLPFAFLVHQRYGSYSTLPHLFFVLGCWCVACDVLGKRRPTLAQYAGVVLVLLVLAQSLMLPIRHYGEHPSGKAVRAQVEQLRLFDASRPDVKRYCFRGDQPVANTTGVAAWDIPAEWWHSGFGSAFSLFVNGLKTYELVSATSSCDVTFVFRNKRLELAAP